MDYKCEWTIGFSDLHRGLQSLNNSELKVNGQVKERQLKSDPYFLVWYAMQVIYCHDTAVFVVLKHLNMKTTVFEIEAVLVSTTSFRNDPP